MQAYLLGEGGVTQTTITILTQNQQMVESAGLVFCVPAQGRDSALASTGGISKNTEELNNKKRTTTSEVLQQQATCRLIPMPLCEWDKKARCTHNSSIPLIPQRLCRTQDGITVNWTELQSFCSHLPFIPACVLLGNLFFQLSVKVFTYQLFSGKATSSRSYRWLCLH